MVTIEQIKTGLGITGDYMDATLQLYLDEVLSFLTTAGVAADSITPGLAVRGVADLWNYGGGDGKFSEYFKMRAAQLSLGR